jgi:hypothetical protein
MRERPGIRKFLRPHVSHESSSKGCVIEGTDRERDFVVALLQLALRYRIRELRAPIWRSSDLRLASATGRQDHGHAAGAYAQQT